MKKARNLNIILFVLEVIALIWMLTGIHLFGEDGLLSSKGLAMFKFFTIDSNFLMGVVALIMAIKENKNEVKEYDYVMKLIGTVGVTITMLISIFFLLPTAGIWIVLQDANTLMHVICPALSIYVFLRYERSNQIKRIHTLTALLPLILYTFYYVAGVLLHLENGVVNTSYDWYGFFALGVSSMYYILPLVWGICYGISFGLWKLNQDSTK